MSPKLRWYTTDKCTHMSMRHLAALAQVSPEQRLSIWCLDWSLRLDPCAFPRYACMYIICVSMRLGARSCRVRMCVYLCQLLCLYGSLPLSRCLSPSLSSHVLCQPPITTFTLLRELCTRIHSLGIIALIGSYSLSLVFLAVEVCGRRSRCNTSTAVQSYDAGPDWSWIIMVHQRQFLPRFCQVLDGHMLHDGDLLSNSGDVIVTIVWRSSPTLDNWKMDMRQKVKWEKWMIMNSLLKWSHFSHFFIVVVLRLCLIRWFKRLCNIVSIEACWHGIALDQWGTGHGKENHHCLERRRFHLRFQRSEASDARHSATGRRGGAHLTKISTSPSSILNWNHLKPLALLIAWTLRFLSNSIVWKPGRARYCYVMLRSWSEISPPNMRQLVGVSSSPDGSLWLGSTTDGSVLIYDTDTGEKICSLKGGDVWEVGHSEALLIHPKII